MKASDYWQGTTTDTATKWAIVRKLKADLFAASDWTQLQDAVLTLAQRTAWTAYREGLQDIELTYANPDDVVFPNAPQVSNTLTPAQIAARTRRKEAMSEAALATVFKTLTPAQAEAYIQTNVTDLASAKAILKIYARLFIAIRNELWSGLPEA